MRSLFLLFLAFFTLADAASEEVVLKTAPVPNRLLRQGDAVYFRDGETLGVRIVLNTRHLDRVKEKILESEKMNWPDHPDSSRYCTALTKACLEALTDGSGKIPFTIEWRVDPNETGTVHLKWRQGAQTLRGLSPDYLKRNFALILEDRFGIETPGEKK